MQSKFRFFFIAIISSLVLSNCSAFNALYDDHEVFVNVRNSEIGKTLTKVLKSDKYYWYWERNQGSDWAMQYRIVVISTEQTEYHFGLEGMGYCSWALIVNNRSEIVEGWKFTSYAESCRYKRFYEGPF